jgi:hypothetical protein
MGEAKRRGTFEQRKEQAIVEGRDKSKVKDFSHLNQRLYSSLEKKYLSEMALLGLLKGKRGRKLTEAEEEAIRKLAL